MGDSHGMHQPVVDTRGRTDMDTGADMDVHAGADMDPRAYLDTRSDMDSHPRPDADGCTNSDSHRHSHACGYPDYGSNRDTNRDCYFNRNGDSYTAPDPDSDTHSYTVICAGRVAHSGATSD